MDIALSSETLSPTRSRSRAEVAGIIGVLSWAIAIVAARGWALSLMASGSKLRLDAAPLFGTIAPAIGLAVIPATLLAIALIWLLPRLCASVSWPKLLSITPLLTATWAVGLAATRGWSSVTQPLLDRHDYLVAVPRVASDPGFLANFVDKLWTYPIHVQGHPPGMLLVLRALREVGLGGAGWATVVVLGIGASAVAAVLIVVRTVAGEDRARACAPFLVLTPAAIWIATSADAFFMGVAAWAVALGVIAVTTPRRSRGILLSVGAGIAAATAAFLSYGLVALGSMAVTLPRTARTVGRLLLLGAAAGAIFFAFYSAGFSWIEALGATIHRYEVGISALRPDGFFAFNNLVAFSLVLGPAVIYALIRLRDRRVWLIAGAALGSVLLSNLSGLSQGEVERIWLPFAPWVVVAACAIPTAAQRSWLAGQALVAFAIQLTVRVPW